MELRPLALLPREVRLPRRLNTGHAVPQCAQARDPLVTTTSPSPRKIWGSRASPMPLGVPVSTTSPARRVMPKLSSARTRSNPESDLPGRCVLQQGVVDLALDTQGKGSAISPVVVSHGLSGIVRSMLLPFSHCPLCAR